MEQFLGSSAGLSPATVARLTQQWTADHAAFASFLADDAIFVNGTKPIRGRAAIAADWPRFFTGPVPFSWKPETVVVLDDGSLAQTKGPVWDPAGNVIAEFRSTWRQESPGVWKIVFDDGACACPPKPAP